MLACSRTTEAAETPIKAEIPKSNGAEIIKVHRMTRKAIRRFQGRYLLESEDEVPIGKIFFNIRNGLGSQSIT
jgi:hypothetical protein